MRIAIGCDHRGLELKQFVMKLAVERDQHCEDFGCYTAESVDYPDIAQKVAAAVMSGGCECGILICDTGIGMSVAANKVKGIRAALCHDVFTASRARQHTDANILCFGTRGEPNTVSAMVEAFLTTQFEGGRHSRRLDKIRAMES